MARRSRLKARRDVKRPHPPPRRLPRGTRRAESEPRLEAGPRLMKSLALSNARIEEENQRILPALEEDYDHLARQLGRRGVTIERLTERAGAFKVAVPSWGLGTGGTRFGRFPGEGEPRDIFEKLEDAEAVLRLVRCTPAVSLHIPWDQPDD